MVSGSTGKLRVMARLPHENIHPPVLRPRHADCPYEADSWIEMRWKMVLKFV